LEFADFKSDCCVENPKFVGGSAVKDLTWKDSHVISLETNGVQKWNVDGAVSGDTSIEETISTVTGVRLIHYNRAQTGSYKEHEHLYVLKNANDGWLTYVGKLKDEAFYQYWARRPRYRGDPNCDDALLVTWTCPNAKKTTGDLPIVVSTGYLTNILDISYANNPTSTYNYLAAVTDTYTYYFSFNHEGQFGFLGDHYRREFDSSTSRSVAMGVASSSYSIFEAVVVGGSSDSVMRTYRKTSSSTFNAQSTTGHSCDGGYSTNAAWGGGYRVAGCADGNVYIDKYYMTDKTLSHPSLAPQRVQVTSSRLVVAWGNGIFSTTGGCKLMGNCVASTNYCEAHDYECRYPNSDSCDITVNVDGVLTTAYIYILSGDKLSVGGTIYQGDYTPANGPNNVQLSSGDTILWRSNSYSNNHGWKICLDTDSGPSTEEIGVYDMPSLTQKKIIPVSAGSVTSIEFDDSGNKFAVGFDTTQNSNNQFIKTYTKDGNVIT